MDVVSLDGVLFDHYLVYFTVSLPKEKDFVPAHEALFTVTERAWQCCAYVRYV
jgi:hypothetical protein